MLVEIFLLQIIGILFLIMAYLFNSVSASVISTIIMIVTIVLHTINIISSMKKLKEMKKV